MNKQLPILFCAAVLSCASCRAMPASLGIMVVGDTVSSADVKKRAERLIGQAPDAADKEFGPRLETLVATRDQNHQLLLYKIGSDLTGASRYVVEVKNGRITALSKKKKNIDGVEDILNSSQLEKKLLG